MFHSLTRSVVGFYLGIQQRSGASIGSLQYSHCSPISSGIDSLWAFLPSQSQKWVLPNQVNLIKQYITHQFPHSTCRLVSQLTVARSKSLHSDFFILIDRDDDITKGSANQRTVQLRPQNVRIRLRVGQSYDLHVQYEQAEDYPVDLYYLMDLSKSMEDDKVSADSCSINQSDVSIDFNIFCLGNALISRNPIDPNDEIPNFQFPAWFWILCWQGCNALC